MPYPDSESPEEGDTALGKDGVGEDIREGHSEACDLGDEGEAEKVEDGSKLQVDRMSSINVEAKNYLHVPDTGQFEEGAYAGKSGGQDDKETMRVGPEPEDVEQIQCNTSAKEGLKDMEEKVEMKDAQGVDIKSDDRGNKAEREKEGDDDKDCSEEEEGGGKEEDANVRDILDKYLPLLEREGARVNQIEGHEEEVDMDRNHNQEELDDGGPTSAEMVVNQVDNVDKEEVNEENREGESSEMVMDKEDINEEKTADEGGEMMTDREDICEEKTKDEGMEMIFGKEDIIEEKSINERIKSHYDGEALMNNARKGGDNPGGILTNLMFGNFDSKGRYCRLLRLFITVKYFPIFYLYHTLCSVESSQLNI